MLQIPLGCSLPTLAQFSSLSVSNSHNFLLTSSLWFLDYLDVIWLCSQELDASSYIPVWFCLGSTMEPGRNRSGCFMPGPRSWCLPQADLQDSVLTTHQTISWWSVGSVEECSQQDELQPCPCHSQELSAWALSKVFSTSCLTAQVNKSLGPVSASRVCSVAFDSFTMCAILASWHQDGFKYFHHPQRTTLHLHLYFSSSQSPGPGTPHMGEDIRYPSL